MSSLQAIHHSLNCDILQSWCLWRIQWHHVWVLDWSGIPWIKQLVSSWSRLPQDGGFSGHMAHLGSHICINANDDTYSSSSSSNGPLPGMVFRIETRSKLPKQAILALPNCLWSSLYSLRRNQEYPRNTKLFSNFNIY